MLRVNLSDTVEGDFALVYHNGEEFSGEAVDVSDDGKIIALLTYRDGILNGPHWENHPDGSRAEEGTYTDGRATGVYRAWHPNGQPSKYYEFDERGNIAVKMSWDANGTPTENWQKS